MSFLKIGGRTSTDVAKGLLVSDDGHVQSNRQFGVSTTVVLDETITDTTRKVTDNFDATKAGLVAIMIYNETGVAISCKFRNPHVSSASDVLYDANGEAVGFTIPNKERVIITPEDVPQLNYCFNIRIACTPVETPTASGRLRIYILTKG